MALLMVCRFAPLSKLFDDVELMVGGIAVMVASCALLVGALRPAAWDEAAKGFWLTAVCSMYAVGYPIGHTAVIGWFSKAMGKRPQGFLMGLFASAGSLARIVLPICSGFLALHYGTDLVFGILAAVLLLTILVICAFATSFRDAIA